jgi:hypothetical protein
VAASVVPSVKSSWFTPWRRQVPKSQSLSVVQDTSKAFPVQNPKLQVCTQSASLAQLRTWPFGMSVWQPFAMTVTETTAPSSTAAIVCGYSLNCIQRARSPKGSSVDSDMP